MIVQIEHKKRVYKGVDVSLWRGRVMEGNITRYITSWYEYRTLPETLAKAALDRLENQGQEGVRV
jgi:hypothetical protein